MRKKKNKNFSIEKAERVRKFIETHCTFSKGEWAGKQFQLLPWQWGEIIKPLFGTLNENGYRQYRTVYCEIPKKNGKSELCAAVGLYMLTSDDEEGAEVYIAAADREQASIVYQAAATMVYNDEILKKHIKRLDSRKKLIYHKKNSFMQVLSSESYTKHGLSPSAVIIDEIHAHPNGELYETLTAGTDYARRQQVVLIITTAGIYDKNSIWWKLRTRAQQVKAGTIIDPRFLPVLYLSDPEKDNPEDEELWKRVNPSLGQIFDLDKIRQDFNEAKNDPVDYQNFLRFRLNIPIKSLSRWMPIDKWDKCTQEVDLESLKGRLCYGGLDLAQTIDLSAFVLVFPPETENDKAVILAKFYCPEENILKRSRVDKVPYDIWRQQGHLIATPGESVDLRYIRNDILQASKDYNLKEIAYDKKFADHLASELLNDYGLEMVEMPQLAKWFNEPMHNLLKEVIEGNVIQDGNPVLRWNMDNMVVRPYFDGSIQPDKSKATDRIDGAVATFMAWGRMLFGEKPSVYEERGLMIV